MGIILVLTLLLVGFLTALFVFHKHSENELNHRVTYNDIDGFQEIIEHYTKDDVKRISYVNDANNLLDKSYPETLITKTWHQAMSH